MLMATPSRSDAALVAGAMPPYVICVVDAALGLRRSTRHFQTISKGHLG